MLGGRLSVSAAAAALDPKAAPPATTAPLRRKLRRVVLADFSSASIVLLIADPRLKLGPHETCRAVHLQLACISKSRQFRPGLI
jgi:hypothetical protein